MSKKRVDAVKALLDGEANLEVVNNWQDMRVAPPELLPTRRENSGATKRQHTALEELGWASEWPIKEQVVGPKMDYIAQHAFLKSADGLRHGEECSGDLRCAPSREELRCRPC